jgi:hypothetical protein
MHYATHPTGYEESSGEVSKVPEQQAEVLELSDHQPPSVFAAFASTVDRLRTEPDARGTLSATLYALLDGALTTTAGMLGDADEPGHATARERAGLALARLREQS